jgi:hypothetical protein
MPDLLEWLYAPSLPGPTLAPLRVFLVAVMFGLSVAAWRARARYGALEFWFLMIGSVMVLAMATLNLMRAAMRPAPTSLGNGLMLLSMIVLGYGMWHRIAVSTRAARMTPVQRRRALDKIAPELVPRRP